MSTVFTRYLITQDLCAVYLFGPAAQCAEVIATQPAEDVHQLGESPSLDEAYADSLAMAGDANARGLRAIAVSTEAWMLARGQRWSGTVR